jgi:hypothetical protein
LQSLTEALTSTTQGRVYRMIELVESKYLTALRWSTMNRQYIRSRSDLPEAFDALETACEIESIQIDTSIMWMRWQENLRATSGDIDDSISQAVSSAVLITRWICIQPLLRLSWSKANT